MARKSEAQEVERSTPAVLREVSAVLTTSIKVQVADLVRTIQGLKGLIGDNAARDAFDHTVRELGGSGKLVFHEGGRGVDVDMRKRSTWGPGKVKGRGGRRQAKRSGLSPEGRARIIAAQRARWNKVRASKGKMHPQNAAPQRVARAKKAARPK